MGNNSHHNCTGLPAECFHEQISSTEYKNAPRARPLRGHRGRRWEEQSLLAREQCSPTKRRLNLRQDGPEDDRNIQSDGKERGPGSESACRLCPSRAGMERSAVELPDKIDGKVFFPRPTGGGGVLAARPSRSPRLFRPGEANIRGVRNDMEGRHVGSW